MFFIYFPRKHIHIYFQIFHFNKFSLGSTAFSSGFNSFIYSYFMHPFDCSFCCTFNRKLLVSKLLKFSRKLLITFLVYVLICWCFNTIKTKSCHAWHEVFNLILFYIYYLNLVFGILWKIFLKWNLILIRFIEVRESFLLSIFLQFSS